ncbi:MAG: hypothetical protein K8R23_15255 [Chthoniobacter sp.]|nr:hypothetical protein [Chthoniobacter sp.]
MSELRTHFLPIAFFLALVLGAILPARATSIVYSGLKDIPIPTTYDGVYLDVDTGLTSTAEFTGWDINPFFGGVGIANDTAFQPVRTGTGLFDPYVTIASGAVIDSGTLFYATGFGGSDTAHFGLGPNQFHPGTDAYLGFRFTTNDGAGPFFGWMRLALTDNVAGALIRDWAYDNSGAPITTGATAPEPGCTVLLLASITAAGLLGRRRGQARRS